MPFDVILPCCIALVLSFAIALMYRTSQDAIDQATRENYAEIGRLCDVCNSLRDQIVAEQQRYNDAVAGWTQDAREYRDQIDTVSRWHADACAEVEHLRDSLNRITDIIDATLTTATKGNDE